MRDEAEVWEALLRRKGLSVAALGEELGITRQHAHRLLTGRRAADSQREELEVALALGQRSGDRPLYGIGELDDDGELDLVPAGDAQPLFANRKLAVAVALELSDMSPWVCVVPVWPAYAWRNLVAFHAAWGAPPEARKVFLVDTVAVGEELKPIIEHVADGLAATLEARTEAHERAALEQVAAQLTGYTDARLPQ